MTSTSRSSSRYQRVIKVLDDAIGGPDSPIAFHGPVEWDMTDDDCRAVGVGSFLVRVTVDEASERQIVQVTG